MTNKSNELDVKLLDMVRRELQELNKYLLTDSPPSAKEGIGLYNGLSGLCLYLYQNYKISNDEEILVQLYSHLDRLLDNIDRREYINGSFSSGMAGCSWMMKFLSENDIIEELESDLIEEINLVLFNNMKQELLDGNIDQLNGAIGIARYFLKAEKYDFVEMTVLHLKSISITNDEETKWLSENWINKENYYNFSLAHGTTGIIQFLHQCYLQNILKDECENLIMGGVKFLLSNIQDYSKGDSFFPNSIKAIDYRKSQNAFQFSRMAWCYGDLGIFYTLFNLAPLISSIDLKKIAIEGFLKLSERIRPESTLLVDPGFCHGTAGVSYLFLKMWLATGEKKFKETAEFWLWKTLKYKKNNEYIFLTGNFENRAFKGSRAFLDGACGVAMIYLAFLDTSDTRWDECVLLN
ncbi:hypothetical protein IM793_18450 [Pedobacter sp. MR2016-19]|uniref:lanthionine synthetase LanC family protein n=1 Tax=Pedobacter sp. MR2016-19 TaxID=2780089 RepID=UPI001876DCB2|nr:lanthionine synthetase LanC family protein [Pedobacter sp. MR2016-19]MBE5321150.1 hypothetical protein [Pedobacter sp. MR2016-19]